MKDKYLLSPDVLQFIESENYSDAANFYFNQQIKEWPQLKIAYESLNSIQEKTYWFDNFKIIAQYNPNRIKSTTANVEENSQSSSDCFLCEKNLPEKQKGIALKNGYALLCNPFPIFPEHFTIPNIEHQPQQIKNSFNDFLFFSKIFGKRYSLIYNGPKCGASAPFHLHFQMGTKNFMSIENDIQQMKNDFGKALVETEEISIFNVDDKCRKILFIESKKINAISQAFGLIYEELKSTSKLNEEPMLNIISSFDGEFGWSLIIFLRTKHRPDIFYKTDESKMLVSPATIDIGGIFIVPQKNDFERMNADTIKNIFREVSFDEKEFLKLSENLQIKFKDQF